MESANFFIALLASIRALGVREFAYDPEALEAALRAAFDEAGRQRISLQFSTKAMRCLTREMISTGDDCKLLTHPNPDYVSLQISLSSPRAAEKFLASMEASFDRKAFLSVAKSFISGFEEAAIQNRPSNRFATESSHVCS